MKTETIVYCIFALLLGMLLAHMLKDVCGCQVVEGNNNNNQNIGKVLGSLIAKLPPSLNKALSQNHNDYNNGNINMSAFINKGDNIINNYINNVSDNKKDEVKQKLTNINNFMKQHIGNILINNKQLDLKHKNVLIEYIKRNAISVIEGMSEETETILKDAGKGVITTAAGATLATLCAVAEPCGIVATGTSLAAAATTGGVLGSLYEIGSATS